MGIDTECGRPAAVAGACASGCAPTVSPAPQAVARNRVDSNTMRQAVTMWRTTNLRLFVLVVPPAAAVLAIVLFLVRALCWCCLKLGPELNRRIARRRFF